MKQLLFLLLISGAVFAQSQPKVGRKLSKQFYRKDTLYKVYTITQKYYWDCAGCGGYGFEGGTETEKWLHNHRIFKLKKITWATK